jgi:N utilization substance protein A
MVKVEELLAKKSSGGILNVDSYDFLNKFIERVETRTFIRSKLEEEAEKSRMAALQAQIPPSFFDTTILDSSLPEHVNYILQEAGYNTIAELVTKMLQAPDDILRLNGIGPKAMNSIQELMDLLPETLAAELSEIAVSEAEAEPTSEEPVDEVAVMESELEEAVAEKEAEEVAEPELEKERIEPEVGQLEEVPDAMIEESEQEDVTEEPVAAQEEDLSFDELFALQSTNIEIPFVEDEEEDLSEDKKSKKKKDKKKKRQVKVEYNEEEDVLIYRKIHKRNDEIDWE